MDTNDRQPQVGSPIEPRYRQHGPASSSGSSSNPNKPLVLIRLPDLQPTFAENLGPKPTPRDARTESPEYAIESPKPTTDAAAVSSDNASRPQRQFQTTAQPNEGHQRTHKARTASGWRSLYYQLGGTLLAVVFVIIVLLTLIHGDDELPTHQTESSWTSNGLEIASTSDGVDIREIPVDQGSSSDLSEEAFSLPDRTWMAEDREPSEGSTMLREELPSQEPARTNLAANAGTGSRESEHPTDGPDERQTPSEPSAGSNEDDFYLQPTQRARSRLAVASRPPPSPRDAVSGTDLSPRLADAAPEYSLPSARRSPQRPQATEREQSWPANSNQQIHDRLPSEYTYPNTNFQETLPPRRPPNERQVTTPLRTNARNATAYQRTADAGTDAQRSRVRIPNATEPRNAIP